MSELSSSEYYRIVYEEVTKSLERMQGLLGAARSMARNKRQLVKMLDELEVLHRTALQATLSASTHLNARLERRTLSRFDRRFRR